MKFIRIYIEFLITTNIQISSFQFEEFLNRNLSQLCTTSRSRHHRKRFPWHGIARIVEWWRGSRVESRDGCHAYLSSNTAKYFRESGLRVLYYVGKLSSTPMYRSTRESAYRKGAAYRPLFATPSCTFKLQGQAVLAQHNLFPSPSFLFFAFLSFTFVNSFRNPILYSDLGSIFRELAQVREKRKFARTKYKYLGRILANIVKVAITTD